MMQGSPIPVDSEDEALNGTNAQRVTRELEAVRSQVDQIASYTAQAEARQNMVLEQIQLQMATILSGLQGRTLVAPTEVTSPEQAVRRVRDVIEMKRKSEESGKARSRSPAKKAKEDDLTARKADGQKPDYTSGQLKDLS